MQNMKAYQELINTYTDHARETEQTEAMMVRYYSLSHYTW